jgi:hypothetical protein
MGIIMSEQTTTTTNLSEMVEKALGTDQEFSPYALAGVVNSLFSSLGVEKEIPTQMTYNYVNNKLIKGVTTRTVATKKGGTREAKFVSREGAVEWITKYVSKNLPK